MGGTLKTVRESLGIGKYDMSRILQLDPSLVTRIEKHERSLPVPVVQDLAKVVLYSQGATSAPLTEKERANRNAWLEAERKKCRAKLHKLARELKMLQKKRDSMALSLPQPTESADPVIQRLWKYMQNCLFERENRQIDLSIVRLEVEQAAWLARKKKLDDFE